MQRSAVPHITRTSQDLNPTKLLPGLNSSLDQPRKQERKGCATTIQETTLPLQDEKRENTDFKIDNLIHFRLFSHAYSF